MKLTIIMLAKVTTIFARLVIKHGEIARRFDAFLIRQSNRLNNFTKAKILKEIQETIENRR
jgi:hypothetical protein